MNLVWLIKTVACPTRITASICHINLILQGTELLMREERKKKKACARLSSAPSDAGLLLPNTALGSGGLHSWDPGCPLPPAGKGSAPAGLGSAVCAGLGKHWGWLGVIAALILQPQLRGFAPCSPITHLGRNSLAVPKGTRREKAGREKRL